ncbi:eCIS core domain-containing protein [Actinomadura nitritigenes]|uniref:eCIS core domain-containing protein n=1 Tax=Actinomadura nitritigenes TaxID=134602 RepID=UPI003D8AF6B0
MTTLGQRLQEAGRHLAARHVPEFPWTAALDPVLARAARNAAPLAGRFDRVERPPDGPAGPPGPPPRARPGTGPGLPASGAADASPGGAPQAAAADREVPLPPDVRGRLRDVAGPGADVLRPHVGPAADAVARGHRADAVALGADVHFRDGRYRPDEPEGFGLLAHEAAHVTQTRFPGPAGTGRPGAGAGHAAEAHALAVESAARLGLPVPEAWPGTVASGRPGAWPAEAGAPAVPAADVPGPSPGGAGPPPAMTGGPQPAPLAAATDRNTAAPPAPVDLERLRREVVADLMRQVRAEFERGG